MNKNIRYCQNSSPYNIFQEDENHQESSPERSLEAKTGGTAEQPSVLSNGKIKKMSSFSNKFSGSVVRGTRGLDIIVDEEEENDGENDYLDKNSEKVNSHIQIEENERSDGTLFKSQNLQDGSICFFK